MLLHIHILSCNLPLAQKELLLFSHEMFPIAFVQDWSKVLGEREGIVIFLSHKTFPCMK